MSLAPVTAVDSQTELHTGPPDELETVRDALSRRDGKSVERAAYRLGCRFRDLGAEPLYALAIQLERLGREGRLAEAEAAFGKLIETGRTPDAP